MKLSKYFSLHEFVRSMTATRRGIKNEPTKAQISSMSDLAKKVLDLVREEFGAFTLTSGFRSNDLNKAIGGSEKSHHKKGEAADFEVMGRSNLQVAEWIKDNLTFDQLILEHHKKGDPNSGWVHVSYSKKKNRGEVLSAITGKKGVEYVKGLPTGQKHKPFA